MPRSSRFTRRTARRSPAGIRRRQPGKPAILYFHGNAGNISERADRFRQIVASGFGLLAVSYRGYPGSGGSPSEAALVSDGEMEFDWLEERSRSIVIHGESLGTGVATEVAAARPPRALILEAPYTAALDIAEATYPWVPVKCLMRDPFLSREYIKEVHTPLLIIHGTADQVIPVEEGKRLFALANEPKYLGHRRRGGARQSLGARPLGGRARLPQEKERRDSGRLALCVRRIPSRAGS